jgi:hypothetical protein
MSEIISDEVVERVLATSAVEAPGHEHAVHRPVQALDDAAHGCVDWYTYEPPKAPPSDRHGIKRVRAVALHRVELGDRSH